jgi:hypothetical protein
MSKGWCHVGFTVTYLLYRLFFISLADWWRTDQGIYLSRRIIKVLVGWLRLVLKKPYRSSITTNEKGNLTSHATKRTTSAAPFIPRRGDAPHRSSFSSCCPIPPSGLSARTAAQSLRSQVHRGWEVEEGWFVGSFSSRTPVEGEREREPAAAPSLVVPDHPARSLCRRRLRRVLPARRGNGPMCQEPIGLHMGWLNC